MKAIHPPVDAHIFGLRIAGDEDREFLNETLMWGGCGRGFCRRSIGF